MWSSGVDCGSWHRNGRQGGSRPHHWRQQGFCSLQGFLQTLNFYRTIIISTCLKLRFWLPLYLFTCQAIEEGVCHMWTVSAFQQHPNTMIIVDEVRISPGTTFPLLSDYFVQNLCFLVPRMPPLSWEWGQWSTSKTCGRFFESTTFIDNWGLKCLQCSELYCWTPRRCTRTWTSSVTMRWGSSVLAQKLMHNNFRRDFCGRFVTMI